MNLVLTNNAALREKAPHHPRDVYDPLTLTMLVRDMWAIMYGEKGIGLAAPQVGLPIKLAVIDCEGFKDVLVNPRVVWRGGARVCSEGCLSLPGEVHMVRRAKAITVEYEDLDGVARIVNGRKSLLAQCLEHECDHLMGKLIDGR